MPRAIHCRIWARSGRRAQAKALGSLRESQSGYEAVRQGAAGCLSGLACAHVCRHGCRLKQEASCAKLQWSGEGGAKKGGEGGAKRHAATAEEDDEDDDEDDD